MSIINAIEIIFIFLFVLVAFLYIKKKGIKEFLFFSLPIILFFFFVEFFWIYRVRGEYDLNKFYISFLGVPLIVPLTWVAVVFFSMWLTKKTFGKNKIVKRESFLLAISDGFWAVLFAVLIFEPLGFYLGLWRHIGIKPFLFGAPFWYFVGWFFGVFLMSFGYRVLKRTSKRNIVSLGYIFLIVAVRYFIYFILKI